MNTPLPIDEFIQRSKELPVIDVRSPGEFDAGHIPGAHNIPLFSDEERARVGNTYKHAGREKAIEIGYEIVNPKRSFFIDEVEKLPGIGPETNAKTVLVHCWRGGMRSEGFAGFLNEHDYRTHTLIRGYKAYRHFVLDGFSHLPHLILVGGETGSGKTEILQKIAEKGFPVIDLEELAHHKGSAFGALGEQPQPTQEQFENDLAHEFARFGKTGNAVWLEDESRSIGTCQLPNPLWDKMKASSVIRVKIPKEERIDRLLGDYGGFSGEELEKCILKIQKRLGPQHAKRAIEELRAGNLRKVVEITLVYYDKAYSYSHEMRDYRYVFTVECLSADADLNAGKVLDFAGQKFQQADA